MTAPQGQGASQIAAALGGLRQWAATLPSTGEPRGRGVPRREVAHAIVDALDRRLSGEAASTADSAAALTGADADLLSTIDELGALRDSLHRRLTAALSPELALLAVDELNELVDAVLRQATEGAVRDLRADAFTDALTGAANRRAFERDFHRALETSKRHGRDLAVIVLDLDELKRLNDEHGHEAGDRALQTLTAAFLPELRAGDGFYRIGGDEFALLLLESGEDAVDALLARAQSTAPSFSYGWAAYPEDGATTAELLRSADVRLFEGRHQRRRAAAAKAAVPAAATNPARAQLVAAAVPVVAALAIAEIIRRLSGVELNNELAETWVGMLVLGGLLGPPVARRWCAGHRDVAATALCASRVGTVVLLVLVMALVPVSRLREALDTAAAQRALEQQQAAGEPGGNGGRSSTTSPEPETPQVALGPPPTTEVAPPAAPAIRRSPQLVERITSSAPAVVPVVLPVLDVTPPTVPSAPAVDPPGADIGTKLPRDPVELETFDRKRSGPSPAKHVSAKPRAIGLKGSKAFKASKVASRQRHH